ncbi:hypothetical protein Btru_072861 [Bulinus truncatus]|nr:hypothetical protein Btru_072861 [Bulinus truncatus]
MNTTQVLLLVGILVGVTLTVSGQRPVSQLCSSVRCFPGNVCRVVQSCAICPPTPVCTPCVPRGVDQVCNRNRFYDTLLTGNPSDPDSLSPRTCNPLLPRDCPFDSVCVPDGFGRDNCCYNRTPIPTVNQGPTCIVNRCRPFCPLGQRCQLVTICPFVPPCFQEFQCRPIFGPLSLTIDAAAALSLGGD